MTDPAPKSATAEADFPAEFAGFWSGLRERRISFPRCSDCGKVHWYPMQRCPFCHGAALEWMPVAGKASLYTWTVVRRSFSPDFPAPYVVGLVEFAEVPGTRLVTNIVGADPGLLRIGMTLEPVFAIDGNALPSVRFRPSQKKSEKISGGGPPAPK
jgi:uncharacterized OB-fold protein